MPSFRARSAVSRCGCSAKPISRKKTSRRCKPRSPRSTVFGARSCICTFLKRFCRRWTSAISRRSSIRAYSPAAGSLAGATYELTGGKLSIHLPANGKAELEPHIPKAQNFLKSRFGVAPEIEITAHSALEGRALFDETARIRREAMAQAPAVQIKEAAKEGVLVRFPPRRRPRAI